jgi:hypothetical protein
MGALIKQELEGSESCDTCNSGFFCSRLHTVMSVLKGVIDDGSDPYLVERFRAVEEKLANAGYAWPNGTRHCQYNESPEHIRTMTDELIIVLGQLQKAPGSGVSREQNYNEEVHGE